MLRADFETITRRFPSTEWTDPDVVLYATWVSVWGRWFIWAAGVFLLAYRPSFWYPEDAEYLLISVLLFMTNGIVHFRLLTKRPVTWRWLFFLCGMDVALTTVAVVINGGFNSFIFLAYYPALAMFAVVFSSIRLNVAWTTMVAIVYVAVCLTVGAGLDIDAGNDKVLIARLAVLFTIVLGINLITRFERARWQNAVEKERHLQNERVEMSQAIHDTTAQTVYMIGLGIHRVRELAGESNRELTAALEATSALSRSAMWELRRPIDGGHIFEGRELGQVLWSLSATFEKITAVPARMSQSGIEPSLSWETRTLLFSIAHNALTNAFLHAHPSRVEVRLDFEAHSIRLSVSDDGVGLPNDYENLGLGFKGMSAAAERMGGVLEVESGEGRGGTTITCIVPSEGS